MWDHFFFCTDATNERPSSFLQEGIDLQSITSAVNQDSSIFSHGYPFHYIRGQTWIWDINFGPLKYVNYQMVNFSFDIKVLIDFSLTVKAAPLIFISGRGLALTSAKEGNSGFINNLVKSF